MVLKINRHWQKPKMHSYESMAMYEDRLGATHQIVTGGIGHMGEKVHKLSISYVQTENGIGLIHIMSLCGSAKFMSRNYPYFNTDLANVNCKKCLRYCKA
uniref:Uncharacterized protein n=1 Tax=viral metagenome TaxID=1070528 RepID=A0A6M3L403_9ZZZZ